MQIPAELSSDIQWKYEAITISRIFFNIETEFMIHANIMANTVKMSKINMLKCT